jgi:hypothetical protein
MYICTCWIFCNNSSFDPIHIPTGGHGAKVSFPDTDERVSEDGSPAKIPVRVVGKDGGNFTVIVTPLTVAQYKAQSDTICDSVIDENLDTAEGKSISYN